MFEPVCRLIGEGGRGRGGIHVWGCAGCMYVFHRAGDVNWLVFVHGLLCHFVVRDSRGKGTYMSEPLLICSLEIREYSRILSIQRSADVTVHVRVATPVCSQTR